MKQAIHPTYYPTATITCASCSTVWHAGSTVQEQHTEICSNCHPFYTGKQHLIDTAGTVEKFKQKQAAAAKAKEHVVVKKPRKARTAKA